MNGDSGVDGAQAMRQTSLNTAATSPTATASFGWQVLRSTWQRRELLTALTRRELSARYRGSALGFVWSLVNPLLLLAVYSLVFGLILGPRLGDGSSKAPYALFLITGLFPWIWTTTSLLEGAASLSANSGLIRKAVFPCELLPLVSVTANLIHFLLAVPILLGALLLGRVLGYAVLGPHTWAVLPVIALQLLALAGAALGLSAACVHFKDIRDLLNNVLQLAFFLAPILYEIQDIPVAALQLVIRCNPFTPFALAYQATLFRGELPGLGLWVQMALLAVVFFTLGAALFARLEDTLVEAV